MTQTANITREMVSRRSGEIASDLRGDGLPVMGIDAPDDTQMIGITFRLETGRLMVVRFHYDDATGEAFERVLKAAGAP